MRVAGADEDMGSLTGTNTANVIFDPLTLEPGTDTSTHPNSAQVSGQVTFRSPFIFSVKSDNIGTSVAPDLMAPKAPYHSVGGAPDNALFNVDSGTYVVTTPTAAASTEYNAGGTQPDPAATTTAGTGMTLQV